MEIQKLRTLLLIQDFFQRNIAYRINVYIAYFNVLYFFEIIHFMVILSILYGNRISISVGILLGILLTFQIIMIFFKRRNARRAQLFIMELHIAYSFPLFIGVIMGTRVYYLDLALILFRLVVCIVEIILVYVLTSRRLISEFDF
jgi:hypothetical protein